MTKEELEKAIKCRAVVFAIERKNIIQPIHVLNTGSDLVFKTPGRKTVYKPLYRGTFDDFYLSHAEAMAAIETVTEAFGLYGYEIKKIHSCPSGAFDENGRRFYGDLHTTEKAAKAVLIKKLEKSAKDKARDLANLRRKIRKLSE